MQYLPTNRSGVHYSGDIAMRCNHCNNAMNKTDEMTELHTRQTWYECPVCEAVHTVSEHTGESANQRIGNKQRFSAASAQHDY
jgi:hypothetical protein